MTRDEVRRLVGGYATGTITESERALLMQAALDDQELFDELAHEQELKNLLEVPGVRSRLAGALAPQVVKPGWWMYPWAWAGLAAAAAVVVAFSLRAPQAPVEIAQVPKQVASSDAPVPAASELDRFRASTPVVTPPAQAKAMATVDRKDLAADAEVKEKTVLNEATGGFRDAAPRADAGGLGRLAGPEEAKKESQAEVRREQVAAAPPPPPTAAAPAGARPPVAVLASKAVVANATGRVAFRYSLTGNTLAINPAQAGFVSVSSLAQKAAPAVRRVTPGTEEQFAIPQGSVSLVVTFSTEANPAQNAVQSQIGQQQVSRQRAGAVNFEPQQDFASVEITIP